MRGTSRASYFVLAVFVLLLAGNPCEPQGVSATDSTGKRVSLSRPAARIVCLSPGAMEVLFAFGAGGRIVGRAESCDYPERALSLPIIGRASAMPSDLVIIDGDGRSPDDRANGERTPVFIYDPRDFLELAESTVALGVLVGMDRESVEVAARITKSVISVRNVIDRIRSPQYPRVFWESKADPLSTCGAFSFAQSLIAEAGGKNVFLDKEGARPAVSRAEVLARDPQVIVLVSPKEDVADLGPSPGEPWLAGTSAAAANRMLRVEEPLASRAGPRSASLLLSLARAFHPGLVP
jgi:iron complex transport system substrate-binding protein